MTFSEIMSAITNNGFPIVCCAVLFMLQSKLNDTLKELAVTLATMNERLDNVEDILVKRGANGNIIQ